MKGKINSYAIINIISLAILILVALWANQVDYFLPSLFSFIGVSSYALAITIYLAGLTPNILLYDAKIFTQYLLALSPLLLILIFLSLINPIYLVLSIFLIPLSYRIIEKSFNKWDEIEQLHF